jgi:hypothetical protein
MWTFVASFFWGTVGFALLVYGKKADEMVPLAIGLVLIVLSYFLSALWLTISAIVLIGIYWMWLRSNS